MSEPVWRDADPDAVTAYVRAAVAAQGLTLEAEALQRVVQTFGRNARLAALVLDFEVPPEVEPAPVFRPEAA
jgi:hypothetical protein